MTEKNLHIQRPSQKLGINSSEGHWPLLFGPSEQLTGPSMKQCAELDGPIV